jgi:hypothetical protein
MKAQSYETKREKTFEGVILHNICCLDEETITLLRIAEKVKLRKLALSGSNWIRYDKIVKFFGNGS